MWRPIAVVAAALGIGATLLAVTLLVGMRTGTPVVVDAVRRFNRAVTNPRVLRNAGAAGASAARLRHAGRTTGHAYETPVGTFPTPDGFLIALPYGTRSDWLQNVLAAGSATLVVEGDTHVVDEPTLVPTSDIVDLLPDGERRMLRLFGVDRCLRLRDASTPSDR